MKLWLLLMTFISTKTKTKIVDAIFKLLQVKADTGACVIVDLSSNVEKMCDIDIIRKNIKIIIIYIELCP